MNEWATNAQVAVPYKQNTGFRHKTFRLIENTDQISTTQLETLINGSSKLRHQARSLSMRVEAYKQLLSDRGVTLPLRRHTGKGTRKTQEAEVDEVAQEGLQHKEGGGQGTEDEGEEEEEEGQVDFEIKHSVLPTGRRRRRRKRQGRRRQGRKRRPQSRTRSRGERRRTTVVPST